MRTKQVIGIVALAAMGMTACASAPDLTPTRAVSKRDMAACTNVADRTVNDPNRQNNQTAVMVGSAIGGGLIGLVVAAAATSADNKAVETNTVNNCLQRKGYKMVPKKTE